MSGATATMTTRLWPTRLGARVLKRLKPTRVPERRPPVLPVRVSDHSARGPATAGTAGRLRISARSWIATAKSIAIPAASAAIAIGAALPFATLPIKVTHHTTRRATAPVIARRFRIRTRPRVQTAIVITQHAHRHHVRRCRCSDTAWKTCSVEATSPR
jgi:hypothetical protein